MTIDEAINKNIKMAELQERLLSNADDSLKEIVMKFATEYRQLAEWLRELKERRSGGWISCKDNMPDTLERGLSTMYSDCCLVCDAFGWVRMAYYITDGQKSWWEFADAQNQNKIDWTEVTHWQPVPEPPKDGEKYA